MNHINFTKLRRLFFSTFLIGSCAINCALAKTDYFVRSAAASPEGPQLLKGSGWPGWKYGYDLGNVTQIELSDLTIAYKVNYLTTRWWATGLVVPFLPTFGLLRFNEADREEGQLSFRVFLKSESEISLDPCTISYKQGERVRTPRTFAFILNGQSRLIRKCVSSSDSSIRLSRKMREYLVDVHVFFDEDFDISSGTIVPPKVFSKSKEISLPNIQLIEDSRFIYFPIIL